MAQLERMLLMKSHSISNAKKPSLRAARSGASRNTTRSQPRRCLLLSSEQDQRNDAGVRILGWCLMTNHVHWVVVPEQEDSLAVLFRRVNGRYAQYLNAGRRRTGHLWQNRYFSCPVATERKKAYCGMWSGIRCERGWWSRRKSTNGRAQQRT